LENGIVCENGAQLMVNRSITGKKLKWTKDFNFVIPSAKGIYLGDHYGSMRSY
jgi:hypothetical protein